MDDFCWPVDTSCCPEFEDYDFDIQDRAVAFAGLTLRALTAYRVGGCPVTVRPCRAPCNNGLLPPSYPLWSGNSFYPVNWNGTWFNCGCSTIDCHCGANLCRVDLPRPVGAVTEVKQDGVVVPATAYRVDDGHWLTRIDGGCWPDCQDMTKDTTQVGTFAVTYLNALPVTPLGEYAAGLLACEFAKGCATGKCRLPSGVTSITRQGITMDLALGVFPDGQTGIREVDTYIYAYNPNHLPMVPAVWSP
jgi:hypothetical protein